MKSGTWSWSSFQPCNPISPPQLPSWYHVDAMASPWAACVRFGNHINTGLWCCGGKGVLGLHTMSTRLHSSKAKPPQFCLHISHVLHSWVWEVRIIFGHVWGCCQLSSLTREYGMSRFGQTMSHGQKKKKEFMKLIMVLCTLLAKAKDTVPISAAKWAAYRCHKN